MIQSRKNFCLVTRCWYGCFLHVNGISVVWCLSRITCSYACACWISSLHPCSSLPCMSVNGQTLSNNSLGILGYRLRFIIPPPHNGQGTWSGLELNHPGNTNMGVPSIPDTKEPTPTPTHTHCFYVNIASNLSVHNVPTCIRCILC